MLEKLKTDFNLYRLRRNEINYRKDIEDFNASIKSLQQSIQHKYDCIAQIRDERDELLKS